MSEIPEYSECLWPVDPACFEDSWDDLDDEVKNRALALASGTLRRLTGYRVGGCPVTVRPCKPLCAAVVPSQGGPPWSPAMTTGGTWVNTCGHTGDCSCTFIDAISLPRPVGRIDEVKVDGDVIDEDDYKLWGNRLMWVGAGDSPWPVCQDLTLDDTEEGTFSVTYLNAWAVDGVGAYAAGVLAMEYAKACAGQKCRLPLNVTTVARQGVSFTLEAGAFPSGMTGIREVDAFIALWNPQNLRSDSTVWSPDTRSSAVIR